MYNASADIKAFSKSQFGSDFHIEIIKFKTKTHDPYEKKTKNRFELRNALYHFLKDQKDFIFEDALDLRNVPQKIGVDNKDYFSSLSHTDDVGVFVFDSHPVGVDFENREKIQKAVVERVSNKDEISLHPGFQIIWSIKEAAFKSIPFMIQPKAVSDIIVENIVPLLNKPLAKFEVLQFTTSVKKSPKITIQGFALVNNDTQLAVAKALIK